MGAERKGKGRSTNVGRELAALDKASSSLLLGPCTQAGNGSDGGDGRGKEQGAEARRGGKSARMGRMSHRSAVPVRSMNHREEDRRAYSASLYM